MISCDHCVAYLIAHVWYPISQSSSSCSDWPPHGPQSVCWPPLKLDNRTTIYPPDATGITVHKFFCMWTHCMISWKLVLDLLLLMYGVLCQEGQLKHAHADHYVVLSCTQMWLRNCTLTTPWNGQTAFNAPNPQASSSVECCCSMLSC